MSNNAPLPILLGGPSGVGKTFLGTYLAGLGCLMLESDKHVPGGFDALGLRADWDAFEKRLDPIPLARELEIRRVTARHGHVILSLASTPLSLEHLRCAKGRLQILFLAGPGTACMRNFLARERPQATAAFWHKHNDRLIAALATSECDRYKIEAIREDGQFVAREVVAQRILESHRAP
jgi:hypothetical protein